MILITDVDGVLTDGGMYYTAEGKVMKKFGPHDSDGFKIIKRELNIDIIAISADKRGFPITESRMKDLNIPLYLVPEEKRTEFIESYGFNNVIFLGDGYHDAEGLRKSRYSYAPLNATPQAKQSAKKVLPYRGGEGFVFYVAQDLKYNGVKNENCN